MIPESVRPHLRAVAENQGWPAGAVDACLDLEQRFPDWWVFYANPPMPGLGEDGFHAGRRDYPYLRPLLRYASADALTAALTALAAAEKGNRTVEFDDLLALARTEALAIKTITEHSAPTEADAFAYFLDNDGRIESPIAGSWHRLIERTTQRNVTLGRLIVLTNDPLSDYERFVLTAAMGNRRAGEDVRVVRLVDHPTAPSVLWLLDRELAAVIDYTGDGPRLDGLSPATAEQKSWAHIFDAAAGTPEQFLHGRPTHSPSP